MNDFIQNTRVLPSISIDNGVLLAQQLVAFAEILDQLNGIEYYLGTAIGLYLQKFWISFAEVNVVMTLERHFGRPEGEKLALERRLEQPCGAKLALERRSAWRKPMPITTITTQRKCPATVSISRR